MDGWMLCRGRWDLRLRSGPRELPDLNDEIVSEGRQLVLRLERAV